MKKSSSISRIAIFFAVMITIHFTTSFILHFVPSGIQRNRTGLITAGIVGSMTNTVFVLSGIYFFFGSQFKGGINDFLALIVSTNSLIEVIATVLITSAVVPALEKIK